MVGERTREEKIVDKYGTFRDTMDDFSELAQILIDKGNVVFSYSEDEESAYVVSLNMRFEVIGSLPWGGRASCFVTFLRYGGLWINLEDETPILPGYLQEKIPYLNTENITVKQLSSFVTKLRTAYSKRMNKYKGVESPQKEKT